jgi:hypothetical protein
VTVVVVKVGPENVRNTPAFSFGAARPFMAVTMPVVRDMVGFGATEDEAVEALKKVLLSHVLGEVVGVRSIRFDELVVQEVMKR